MSEFYANRLRAEAGRMEAEIARLSHHRDSLLAQYAHSDDDTRDALAPRLDRISDQIGALETAVAELDEEIAVEDPEQPWRAGVL